MRCEIRRLAKPSAWVTNGGVGMGGSRYRWKSRAGQVLFAHVWEYRIGDEIGWKRPGGIHLVWEVGVEE